MRLVLAVSLDGRLAPCSGGVGQLGGAGDRSVLEHALAWSDGALIGGGTLKSHQCTCLIHQPDLLQARVLEGRSQQPTALVVSSGLGHKSQWPFFSQPIQRWLLRPSQGPSETDLDLPLGYERILKLCPNWIDTMNRLAEAGFDRLLLLGGSKLIASFLQVDLVDELQLTFTPRLLGGEHSWVPFNMNDLPSELQGSNAWDLQSHEPLGGNELLLRYIRKRS